MIGKIFWYGGWLIAVLILFSAGLKLPELILRRRKTWSRVCRGFGGLIIVVAVAVLTSAALTRHDKHFDLTRERLFTPDPKALEVIESLIRPVRLTYFSRADDPEGIRTQRIVELLGQQSKFLDIAIIDPGINPRLARSAGVQSYNAALLEADGRRLVVKGADETNIALGIQRILREERVEICFLEGHGEYPSDNYEFHTHVEKLGGHAMGHTHGSEEAVVQTISHGVGRFRRSLESLGYDIRVILPAVDGKIDTRCQVIIDAGPRSTYSAIESAALVSYLESGGSALLMYDLGFLLGAEHIQLLEHLGLRLDKRMIVDPGLHYAADEEMVAVTAYENHRITERMSFSFYPGVRPLERIIPVEGITITPLFYSSKTSYLQEFRDGMAFNGLEALAKQERLAESGPYLLAAASSGSFSSTSTREFRVIVVGDADFASNSFYPYMSNNRIAIAMVQWLAREEGRTLVSKRIPVPKAVNLVNQQRLALILWHVVALPCSIA
ncbi:MAG TPA: hypothetical protein DGR97_10175, partial [Gammaproteobacteria bacterium]|nr:hypothetical protein [Gammaproteobacteria bacterium]